jgi:periplasmic protein TonB
MRWMRRYAICFGVLLSCTALGAQQPGTDSVEQLEPPAASNGIVGSIPGGISAAEIDEMVASLMRSMPKFQAKIVRVAPPLRIRVSQGVSQALLLKKVNPEYPVNALRTRIQGSVVLHVLISKAGDVSTVELITGHPMLAPAAIEAVKQWKYKPYLLNGQPVEVDTQVLVQFMLPLGYS